jgi:cytochrome c oxidase subunit IV
MSHAPIVSVRLYVLIFAALLVLTAATVGVAYFDLGVLNTPVALGIAFFKASLVVIYFMGLRYNTPLTKLVAIAGFFWLVILFGITISDYLTRSWLGVPGR